MSRFLYELRFALRRLRKDWRVSLPVIAIFALAIGATTSVFTLVDAILYRDLPFAEPGQLVRVWSTNPGRDISRFSSSNEDFLDWRDSVRSMELTAFQTGSSNLSGDGMPQRVVSAATTANFAPMLGIEPVLGRWFTEEEDQPGGRSVAVLSYPLARDRFGSGEAALGNRLEIDGAPVDVIGVAAEGFQFPADADLWRPMQIAYNADERDNHMISVIGKVLAPATFAGAEEELQSVAAEIARQYPDKSEGWSARIVPLREWLVDDGVRDGLQVLFGAILLVLLIACFNVAGLLLARAGKRNQEFVVEAALGAGQWRLISQGLTEGLLLAATGGALGALLAEWTVAMLRVEAAEILPLTALVELDWRAVAFTAATVTAAALLTGIAPALRLRYAQIAASLKDGGRSGSAGRQTNRFRTGLAVGQLALSIALLVGAGLMIQSLTKLQNAPLGYDASNVLTASIAPQASSQAEWTTVFRNTLQQLRNTPGVESAAMLSDLPFSDGNTGIDISSNFPSTLGDGETLQTYWRIASPDYFKTMGMALLEGRDFTEADDEDSAREIVLTRAAAASLWPNESAIGKQVVIGSSGTPIDVVGVVSDIRHRELETVAGPGIYINYRYWRWYSGSFAVKPAGDPSAMVPAIREAVAAQQPGLPLYDVKTLSQSVSEAAGVARLNSRLLTGFAAAAALLAAIGIYGVLAFLVDQRRAEFGIRLAVGANATDILRLVLGNAGRLFISAAGIGLGMAWVLSRLIAGSLYETEPFSVVIYGGVVAVAALVTISASWLPANRAARLDPVVVLRHD